MLNSYSPLRYPGGKAKLYNLIQPIVSHNLYAQERIYIEPFAGGSGLALRLLFNGDVDQLILNDKDYKIFCFWDSCLNHTDMLCKIIENCEVNIETWVRQKEIYDSIKNYSSLEVGFATLFLNRCNVSGVISGGPIGGRNQKGNYKIDARFKKDKLINLIKTIGENNHRITFLNYNASDFLLEHVNQYNVGNTFLNIDPPYVKKGPLLYENSFNNTDHTELANIIEDLQYKWIVTYDECELVYNLYTNYRKEIIKINYSTGSTKTGTELLIYSNNINIPPLN